MCAWVGRRNNVEKSNISGKYLERFVNVTNADRWQPKNTTVTLITDDRQLPLFFGPQFPGFILSECMQYSSSLTHVGFCGAAALGLAATKCTMGCS